MSLYLILTTLWLLLQNVGLSNSQACSINMGGLAFVTGDTSYGHQVIAGWRMAIRDFHTNSLKFFSLPNLDSLNCTFNLEIRDTQTTTKYTVIEGLSLSLNFDDLSFNIPITFGLPYSGPSVILNPLLDAFNLLQLSAGATSTFLTDYPSFFRTIASDDIQAKALIRMCERFGWTSIGVVHMSNNDYGVSIARAITLWANEYGVNTESFSYIENDNVTIADAVESMKESGLFIFALIAYDSDIRLLTNNFRAEDMLNFPYFYLGTDAWVHSGLFYDGGDLNEEYGGLIGTCPFSPSNNEDIDFPYPLNITLAKYYEVATRYETLLQDVNEAQHFYNTSMGTFWFYGYDNVQTVLQLVDKYIDVSNHGGAFKNGPFVLDEDAFNTTNYGLADTNSSYKTRFLNLFSEVSFTGLTGLVSFDANGDRQDSMITYCNILYDGTIDSIGYFRNGIDEDHFSILPSDEIVWPDYFDKRGATPLSGYSRDRGISAGLLIFLWIIASLSVLLTFAYVMALVYYRETKIIKSSQWKITGVMCCGCLLAFICVFLYGIDEESFNNIDYTILCNTRPIMINFATTLIFGPLMAKVYRINFIFNIAAKSFVRETISDMKLVMYILLAVLVEFIVSVLIVAFATYERMYQEVQTDIYTDSYGSCGSTVADGWLFIIILGVPKLFAAGYCIYLAMSVYTTVAAMKFNEGLQTMMCVVISASLILLAAIVLSVIRVESESTANLSFAFLSLVIFIVTHFSLAVMILPRLLAIWRGTDEDFVDDYKKMKTHAHLYVKTLRAVINERDVSHSGNAGKKSSGMLASTSAVVDAQSDDAQLKNSEDMVYNATQVSQY